MHLFFIPLRNAIIIRFASVKPRPNTPDPYFDFAKETGLLSSTALARSSLPSERDPQRSRLARSHPGKDIAPLPFQITLYQAVAKGKAMDFIVQKAAELGAHRIVLSLQTSVPEWDGAKAGAKVEKWRSVCIESIKQCGSAWLPTLEMPMKPSAAIEEARAAEFFADRHAAIRREASPPHIDAYAAEKGPSAKKTGHLGPPGKGRLHPGGDQHHPFRCPADHAWPICPPQ
ncbi:MAG: hypothetical protein CM1200mP34_1770 [Verrucomicrobiales bacterium]|nr:MAG: hypothetical protein CM1200mP34_1770 [Verrucomicrobiales bacterium]